MSKLFLFLFLFSNLLVTAQEAGSNASVQHVQINMSKYSLAYSDGWVIDTSRILGIDLILRSPKEDSLDQFIENMTVFVQDLSGQNYYLSKMGEETESQIKNFVTDVEILESRMDSTSSQPYYSLKYLGRQGKFFLITEQRFFLKNDVGIALTFTAQNSKEEDYRLKARKIFESFKWL